MNTQFLVGIVTQYGYIGLFVILALTILGLPLPVEFLLTFIGFLTFTGQLHPVPAILFAAGGCAAGSTVSYFFGLFFQHKILGHLEKYAGGKLLEKVLNWYQAHGGRLLTAGYFVPGLRHVSGYIAGFSKLDFRSFALYSYLGAGIWTASFILLGRILGSRWKSLLPLIHHYALLIAVLAVVLVLLFYLLYKNHERLMAFLSRELSLLPARYLSLGKRRFLITIGSLLFIGLFVILMGLIQDFVFHEVGRFDNLVVSWLDTSSLPQEIVLMRWVNALGTHLAVLLCFMGTAIVLKKTTRSWMHVLPLALAWAGGTVIDQLFRVLFRGETLDLVTEFTPLQAPSTGFLLAALSFYAVLAYLAGLNRSWYTQLGLMLASLSLLFLLAFSAVYLHIHTPSAMVASVTVSGLWALVCVFVYEFRMYQAEKQK